MMQQHTAHTRWRKLLIHLIFIRCKCNLIKKEKDGAVPQTPVPLPEYRALVYHLSSYRLYLILNTSRPGTGTPVSPITAVYYLLFGLLSFFRVCIYPACPVLPVFLLLTSGSFLPVFLVLFLTSGFFLPVFLVLCSCCFPLVPSFLSSSSCLPVPFLWFLPSCLPRPVSYL